jgi:Flp pilus assembly protein TadG
MIPMVKLNERGAVAAEFAILLPVLMLIVFGTIEFGRLMYGREIVTNATREGARYGIVAQAPPVSSAAMITQATTYLTATGINPAHVTFSAPACCGATGTPVTLAATYNYHWLIPYIATVIGAPSPLPISIATTMRHE